MAAHQAPPPLGFSRQEHWSGLAISFSSSWKWKVKVKSFSHVQLLATSWTAAYQVPLSMGFSRQEDWSGVPLPSPLLTYIHPIKEHLTVETDKGPSSQNFGFSSSHFWMWDLDHKESWAPKTWCFWTVVLEKTLESPWDSKEIKPVHPKGNNSWIFIGKTNAEATPILCPPDVKNWLIGKDWCWER